MSHQQNSLHCTDGRSDTFAHIPHLNSFYLSTIINLYCFTFPCVISLKVHMLTEAFVIDEFHFLVEEQYVFAG